MTTATRFRIAYNTYTMWLFIVGVVLVLTHLSLNYYHHEVEEIPWLIRQLFELDEENNIPTWFSSFLLLNASVVLIAARQSKPGPQRIYWLMLALGFLLLAIDEVAGLHESFHTAIDFNWAIAGAGVAAVAGLFFIPFLVSLEKGLAIRFVISGIIFISGALGAEWLSRDMDEDSLAYNFATAAEESLEMLGAWLFLRFNLVDLEGSSLDVVFSGSKPSDEA